MNSTDTKHKVFSTTTEQHDGFVIEATITEYAYSGSGQIIYVSGIGVYHGEIRHLTHECYKSDTSLDALMSDFDYDMRTAKHRGEATQRYAKQYAQSLVEA